MAETTTEIKKISANDLNELLSFADTSSSTTVAEEKNVFAKPKDPADVALSSSSSVEKTQEEIDAEKQNSTKPKENLDEILNASTEKVEVVDDKDTSKQSELEILNDLVKSGDLFLFDAEEGQKEKALSEYSKKERIELIKANLQKVREDEQDKAASELFNALPEKLQHAFTYVLNGGDKLEALFQSLAQSVHTENLDVKTEAGQEQIVRRWGALTELTEEEIEEEITSLKDMPGALEKKALVYKPKLDAKQQQMVEQQVKQAEANKQKEAANAAKYRETILNTLSVDNLDGLKLTSSVQNKLFNGLANFDQVASNGKRTNGLGILLEKYNLKEPNPALIAKVYWLLNDAKGFEDAILARGNTAKVAEIARTLKTESSQKSTATTLNATQTETRRTVKKPTTSVFARQ